MVALLFVIFDVEVAFFFPWAEVFGKANAIANLEKPTDAAQYREYAAKVLDLTPPPTSAEMHSKAFRRYEELTKLTPEGLEEMNAAKEKATAKVKAKGKLTTEESLAERSEGALKSGEFEQNRTAARELALLAFGEVLVFFGVLLVGFAYLWRRGDLAWVRSTLAEQVPPPVVAPPPGPIVKTASRAPAATAGHS